MLATWFTCALLSAAASDWPEWRGPNGDGTAPDQDAPLKWSAEEGVLWKVPLSQPANGSPIVVAGKVFLTAPEDPEGKQRSLYCFDRKDGAQLWVRTIDFGRVMPTHETNPYCGTTPASDGKHVVVWHGSAGLWCYDMDGNGVWHHDLGEFRHMWGYGTSPVLHEGRVILHSGPGAQSFVASFDLATGKELWRTDEPNHLTPEEIEKKRLSGSWCTPLVKRVGERDLVLCAHPTRVVAYDAKDGSIVWWCEGLRSSRGDLTYGSPVLAGDVCVVLGGYQGPILGVKIDGEGDVTETHRVWYHEEQLSNCASGIYADGSVFVPDMRGQLWCLDPKTGEARWQKRVSRGNTWGSIVHVDGRLYLLGQKGTTAVFEPNSSDLVVIAENEIDEATNSTLAFSDGQVFLRTHEHLYCIGE